MFRDFGDGSSVSSSDKDEDVFIKTLSILEQRNIMELAEKNKKFIDPYRVRMSSNIKISKNSFGVFYKKSLVGSIIFWNFEELKDETSISFWVDYEHHNKGIAQKAIKNAVDFIFSKTDIENITAHIASTNEVSRHVVEKLGFVYTGRRVLDLVNGKTTHSVYSLRKTKDD